MRAQIPAEPRYRRLTLVAVLALLCALVSLVPAEAKGLHRPRPLYWGALIGSELTGVAAPWDMNAVEVFAQAAGKRPSLIGFSAPFADCTVSPCETYPFPTTPMESIRQYGAIPVLSWSSSTASTPEDALRQPAFRLARVIDGTYDPYITEFAEAASAWGHPFFLRFNWEMNGFWFPWSEGVNRNRRGQFVKAWRHVHDIFTSVGATNATWVWCPNIALLERLKRFRQNYPGHAYVDWTCLDGFNWGKTASSAGWMTFDRFFAPAYREVLEIARRKPMMIGEVASEERGGSKAAWIRHLLRVVPTRYRRVRGLVWFNQTDQGMHWPIESSAMATQAFATGIRPRIYMPNVFSEIATSPIAPPTLP